MSERRFSVNVPSVPVPRRSGMAETIGMNEAALGADLWGRNLRVVSKRAIRAAELPHAFLEGVPHVHVRAYGDVRHVIGETLHGK